MSAGITFSLTSSQGKGAMALCIAGHISSPFNPTNMKIEKKKAEISCSGQANFTAIRRFPTNVFNHRFRREKLSGIGLCLASRGSDAPDTISEKDDIEATRDAIMYPRLNDDENRTKFDISSIPSRIFRRITRELSSFPLAIGIMFAVAIMSSLGTIIEQGESLDTYKEYYPEDHPLFGFLTWKLLIGLALDHIYTSPVFLSLLLLLAASLIACTANRQWPLAKVSQRWSFLKKPEAILKLDAKETLKNASVSDLATLLSADGFQVFLNGSGQLYAFKGLLGRIAPIGVHAALLLVMAGGFLSAAGGYRGSAVLPEGSEVLVGEYLNPNGFLSRPTRSMSLRLRVDGFSIEYRPDGQVKQFFSELSLVDLRGQQVHQETVSVNSPLRFGGVTMYQTDWGISSVQIRVDQDPTGVSLPMAMLSSPDSSNKLFGTFLPLGDDGVDQRRGISILAQDLQTVVLYDAKGQFVGVRRPGSGRPITVEGVTLVVEDLVGSTGLQMKMDPSVPYVYAGFGALMVTTAISYMSHSQIWALQEGSLLYVGGKSNRAKLSFQKDLDDLLNYVPEIQSRDGRI